MSKKINIEDLCGFVVKIYTKKTDVKEYNYKDTSIKCCERHETLLQDLEDEGSVINYFKDDFLQSINSFGNPEKTFEFFVDYNKENEIPDIIDKFVEENKIDPIICLVTGSRYTGNDNYETDAYVFNYTENN